MIFAIASNSSAQTVIKLLPVSTPSKFFRKQLSNRFQNRALPADAGKSTRNLRILQFVIQLTNVLVDLQLKFFKAVLSKKPFSRQHDQIVFLDFKK